MRVYGCGGQI